MNAGDARLMRAIRRELTDRIASELQTADARERVAFMAAVLDYFAADLDLVPALSAEAAPHFRKLLEDAIALLPVSESGPTPGWERVLAAVDRASDQSSTPEMERLRELAADIARCLADLPPEEIKPDETNAIADAQSLIAAADRQWLRTLEAERETTAPQTRAMEALPSPSPVLVTPASMTNYLRRVFAHSPSTAAKSITPVPGGRSKRTILIDLKESGPLPSRIVMRQDMYQKPGVGSVGHEYGPLLVLSELGLPVPKPMHFEPRATELGPPFLLVEYIEGKVPGSYFAMEESCPLAFLELARTLARLHRIEPKKVGVDEGTAVGPHGRMGEQVEQYSSQWRKNAMRASPIIESAYAWARGEYAASTSPGVLVHGDCGPHNLLVHERRLTGLLDWEFMHIGDPAEDLGIARVYAEAMMPWQQFMQAYCEAGGADVPERRIRLGMLLHYLKGTVLVAVSGRNFAEGNTDEFIKGANSYTGLRRIEMKIVEFFDRFGMREAGKAHFIAAW